MLKRVSLGRRRSGGSIAPPVGFIDSIGMNAPGTVVDVGAATLSGHLVAVFGGQSTGNVAVNWDASVDLENDNNGSGVSMGLGYSFAPATNPELLQFTASVSLHRARTLTFENAGSMQSEPPDFLASSTTVAWSGFPGGTVPGGGGRVVLLAYSTAAPTSWTPPTSFTALAGGTGLTFAAWSDTVLNTFNGASGSSGSATVKGVITSVVLT